MKRWIVFSLFSALLGLVSNAWSASVINLYSQPGLGLDVFVQAGYGENSILNPNMTLAYDGVLQLDQQGLAGGGPDRSGEVLNFSATADQGIPPAGSGEAYGTGTLDFTYGDVGTNDSFSIGFSGAASALTAEDSLGNPVGAFVTMATEMAFSVNSIGYGGSTPSPGDVLGTLTLNQLAAPGTYESASVILYQGAIGGGSVSSTDLTAALLAGNVNLALMADYAYQLVVGFSVDVPHGIDPPFSFGLTGGINAVPEPSTWLLMGIGLLLLLGMQRKKLF